MKTNVLNSGEFNSSACLLINRNVVYAFREKKLTRDKFTKKFPNNNIDILVIEEFKIQKNLLN